MIRTTLVDAYIGILGDKMSLRVSEHALSFFSIFVAAILYEFLGNFSF